MVGNVAAQRPQSYLRVLVEITLAELEEAPARRQACEAARHRLTGERVEHDVDAPARSCVHDLIEKSERAGVHHPLGAKPLHELALDGRSRSRKDARADAPRD